MRLLICFCGGLRIREEQFLKLYGFCFKQGSKHQELRSRVCCPSKFKFCKNNLILRRTESQEKSLLNYSKSPQNQKINSGRHHPYYSIFIQKPFSEDFPSREKVQLQIQTKMSALQQLKSRLQKESESLNLMDLSQIPIGRFSEEAKKYLQRFKKVKVLILRHCDLDSLENLPNWKLSAIDLSENKFTDSIISKLITISSLTQILLMDNKIESLENIKQLSVLKHLQELDFSGNQVAHEPNYRPILFDSIKSLEIVDQRDLNGQWAAEEEEEEEDSEYNEGEVGDSQQEQYEEEEEDQSSQKPKRGGVAKKK